VTDADGGQASVANFVEVAVAMGGSAASTVAVTGAKRGSIATGSGDDAITLVAYSNASGTDNGFTLDAGDGDDALALAGWKNWTRFTASLGDGDDLVSITGAGADSIDGGAGNDRIDAGGGNDRLAGGAGQDVFVFRAGSGRDLVSDFLPGTDWLELAGIAPAAVRFAASGGGLVVSWGGTDTVTLAGVGLAQAASVGIIFD
jgi:Ca2+-binding RTX toxin-like protein